MNGMMDCKKVEKHLVEYLYQELSPEKTLQVEKHLETCDACAKTLHNWRGIHRGFQRSNDVPQPAPFLKTRILAAAKQELGRKTPLMERILVILKPAVIMPILIFAVLVVWFLPVRRMEFARAKPISTPAQSTRSAVEHPSAAPSAPVAKEQPVQLSEAERDQLKSLGYIGGTKSDEGTQSNEPAPSRPNEPEVRQKSKAAPMDQVEGGRTEVYTGVKDQEQAAPSNEAQQIAQQPSPAASYPSQVEGKLEGPGEKQSAALADKKAAAGAAPAALELSKTAPAGKDADTNMVLAQENFKNGDLSNGKRFADVVSRTDKSNSRAEEFDQYGRAYQAQGACQQAIVNYNQVLKNYPNYQQSPDVLQRLAECYEQIGQYENASVTYQQLQQVPAKNKLATEKLRSLSKKRKSQEELRSLGYVDEKNKQ